MNENKNFFLFLTFTGPLPFAGVVYVACLRRNASEKYIQYFLMSGGIHNPILSRFTSREKAQTLKDNCRDFDWKAWEE